MPPKRYRAYDKQQRQMARYPIPAKVEANLLPGVCFSLSSYRVLFDEHMPLLLFVRSVAFWWPEEDSQGGVETLPTRCCSTATDYGLTAWFLDIIFIILTSAVQALDTVITAGLTVIKVGNQLDGPMIILKSRRVV